MVDEEPLHWPAVLPRRGTAALLHGMMSLGATWWRIGPDLAARGWDVRALDLAAHGSSPRLTGPLTVDALVDKAVADLDGPVELLVGHSLGAVIAASAAARHPGLARALVLEDPPGGRQVDPAVLAAGVEQDAATAAADRDRLVRRSRSDNPGWAEPDVEEDVHGIEAADAAAVAAGLRGGLRNWDLPALVGAVGVPVLLIAAEPGRSALSGQVRAAVRSALPADRFVELPGGHCLHRDVPDRWLAAVDAFTDEVLPAR